MTVREFDGSDDTVAWSTGGLSGCTFGTFASIFKTNDITGTFALLYLHTTGPTFSAIAIQQGDTGIAACGGGGSFFEASLTTGVWYLVVVRKATGTATPRSSVYNFNSTTWTHGNNSSTEANWTAPGASGSIRTDFQNSADFFSGRMAVSAGWNNEVHWAADTTGDSQIEAAGLEDSLQNWVDESPTALWPFNQDPLSAVDDIIGGADQSSVTGTTVVTGDDPPGFSFDLGAPAVPTLLPVVQGLSLN